MFLDRHVGIDGGGFCVFYRLDKNCKMDSINSHSFRTLMDHLNSTWYQCLDIEVCHESTVNTKLISGLINQ
jgi:hypothetical protein